MASSTPEVNLTRAKEMGKYNELTEFSTANLRPHETSRVLAAEDVDIVRKCGGCGKNMSKVKDSLVCSCKEAIHCSKDCFKTSKHTCQEAFIAKSVKSNEVLKACDRRYLVDRISNKGPSSDKITSLFKTTKGANHKVLNYAERGIATAAYVVGSAYMLREFERGARFAIPLMYKEQSIAETDEIAIKWLKVAAEGDVPEAMYCLFRVIKSRGGLNVDQRVAHFWLHKAYDTGRMDYLIQILETPVDYNFSKQFGELFDDISENNEVLLGSSLGYLLMATRFRELAAWDGKTAMGKRFYGYSVFTSIMELIGELKNEQSGETFIEGVKKTVLVISARPGHSDLVDECASYDRDENNLKFLQAVKDKASPDYQLVVQTTNIDGRTKYLVSCKHNQFNLEEKAKWNEYKKVLTFQMKTSFEDISKTYKHAGECYPCGQEAKPRLHAISLGLFTISLTPLMGCDFYAARYAKQDGVIVQDVFTGYSKPDMRQLLQCLMSNPADLHPLAIAEDANLFWPIIWFWGSVYEAVRDNSNKATLDAIYHSLGDKIAFLKNPNASALAAFPEAAAGEWRIACGNENCVRVDHEVKFNLCAGCKVRRYCNEACQRKDWGKHMQFCKARKKQEQ